MSAVFPPDLYKRNDALAVVAKRLTNRDKWLLSLLYEHRVLTTEQIALLAFASLNAAQHRLVILHRMGILDRFRPYSFNNKQPFHYVVGPLGALVLAAQRGIEVSQLGYRRERTLAIAHSPMLAHLVGVNGFFAELSTLKKVWPGVSLVDWWSERRCIQVGAENCRLMATV